MMYADIMIIAFVFFTIYKCKIRDGIQTDYLAKDKIVSIKGIMALTIIHYLWMIIKKSVA